MRPVLLRQMSLARHNMGAFHLETRPFFGFQILALSWLPNHWYSWQSIQGYLKSKLEIYVNMFCIQTHEFNYSNICVLIRYLSLWARFVSQKWLLSKWNTPIYTHTSQTNEQPSGPFIATRHPSASRCFKLASMWYHHGLIIHSPPKETQHLLQEPPQPQFRVSDPKGSKDH